MKQKYDVIQKGHNPDYPKEAYTWTPSQPVPEWILDRARISGFNEKGEPILITRKRSSGGIDILEANGRDTLVSLRTEDSWILYSSSHPLMSVTPHQLDLLYDIYLRD